MRVYFAAMNDAPDRSAKKPATAKKSRPAMDTYREYLMLNDLWNTGKAPWKRW